jgi:hypothetical protein
MEHKINHVDWHSFDFFYPGTTSAAPAFVLFESWAPRTYSSGDVSRRLHRSVGREKIGGANASGAQLSKRRKAGAASVSMVTAKVGQPPISLIDQGLVVPNEWRRPIAEIANVMSSFGPK